MPLPKTYTLADIAEMVDRSTETVRRWVRNGTIPVVQIGREYRVSAADLNAWWQSRGGGQLVPEEQDALAGLMGMNPSEGLGKLRRRGEELGRLAEQLEEWSTSIVGTVDGLQHDEEESAMRDTSDRLADLRGLIGAVYESANNAAAEGTGADSKEACEHIVRLIWQAPEVSQQLADPPEHLRGGDALFADELRHLGAQAAREFIGDADDPEALDWTDFPRPSNTRLAKEIGHEPNEAERKAYRQGYCKAFEDETGHPTY